MSEFEIATIPSVPRRSIAESMLGQAAVRMPGLAVDADGMLEVDGRNAPGTDPGDLSVAAVVDTDAFVGFRSFLDLAGKVRFDGSPVKWQLTGPVTLGVALEQAGLDRRSAFELASASVRSSLMELSATVTEALPNSPQLVVIDEPSLTALMTPGFPIPPDEAIDRMSGAMAALPATTVAGVHCCGPVDVATMLASGPGLISLPVSADLVDWAGYLSRFIDDGGIVAWGVIATGGPVPSVAERPWRELSDLWCALVQRGCDPVRLRTNSLVSPQCGLAPFSVSVARRIARLAGDVGKRVKDQASATRFALGA
jgi:methionine synthase II (cobalamin-independent)